VREDSDLGFLDVFKLNFKNWKGVNICKLWFII